METHHSTLFFVAALLAGWAILLGISVAAVLVEVKAISEAAWNRRHRNLRLSFVS